MAVAMQLLERGVDYKFYQNWTRVGAVADIQQLGQNLPLSVNGVPFSHWAPGGGMVAVPAWCISNYLEHPNVSLLWTGALCVGCFWLSFWRELELISGAAWATLGCLLAAVGTPLGYYSLSISSEAVYLLPLGVLTLQFAQGLRGDVLKTLPVAASTCLLLLIRPYLGVYAWPTLAVLMLNCRSWRERGSALTIVGLAISAAVWQISTTNFWMTGSPWRSPYAFGDEQFQSVDVNCPNLWHVLFDTFHGLLPNHPFIGLGFMAMLTLAVMGLVQRRPGEIIMWLVMCVCVLVHAYIQGCWYYWWMAENSFSMRGLVAVPVPTVIAFVYLCSRLQVACGHLRIYWLTCQAALFLAVLMSVWSWLIWQQGPMDYVEWMALIEGQCLRLRNWTTPVLFVILCASGMVMCFWLAQFKPARSLTAWMGILGTLLLAHLFERAEISNFNLLVFYCSALVCSLGVYGLREIHLRNQGLAWGLPPFTSGLLCLTVLLSFARLEWHTRPQLSTLTTMSA